MNVFWSAVRTISPGASTAARHASTRTARKLPPRLARPSPIAVEQPPPSPPTTPSSAPGALSPQEHYSALLGYFDNVAEEQAKLKAEMTNEIEYLGLRPGEIYSPFELNKNLRVVKKRRRSQLPRSGPSATEAAATDPFLFYNIDPVKEALSAHLLNGYLTTMGKIKGRNETLLPRRTQRRMGKAIRRARNLGIMPNMVKTALGVSRFDASAVLNHADPTIAEGGRSR